MPYDAVKMADWQISEAAEENMPTPDDWVEKLGLKKDDMLPWGGWANSIFSRSSIASKTNPTASTLKSPPSPRHHWVKANPPPPAA